jgi:hypothetical protein
LLEGIEQNSLIPISGESRKTDLKLITAMLKTMQNNFDVKNGGTKGAPKFMMPNNWQFLLHAGHQLHDEKILSQVKLTLQKMAFGGVYDQIGGGFARYSTDETWKVPHFEKMLYDNAQLLSLYSEAFKTDPNPLYVQVISETVNFLKRELYSPENGFYSSLDADSDGLEGKFYVWQKLELQKLLSSDFNLFSDYYHIDPSGLWEDNQYILFRTEENSAFAVSHHLSEAELETKVKKWKKLLLLAREKRIRPSLDDKILTSWNAMTITGLIDCFNAFGNPEYLDLALANATFLKQKLMNSDGRLLHSYKNDQAKIEGFLEDYAFTVEAYLSIFESTGIEGWLTEAKKLTDIAFSNFYDERKSIFYFTSHGQNDLISRTFEVTDNVIPASNSVMSKNLFRLAYLLDKPEYLQTAQKMLDRISGNMADYPSGYSNWAQLLLNLAETHFEAAIVGHRAVSLLHELQRHFLPQVIFCAGTNERNLALLQDRFVAGKTLIYICQDKSCKLPVETAAEALSLIRMK